jgi:hypothetical protein
VDPAPEAEAKAGGPSRHRLRRAGVSGRLGATIALYALFLSGSAALQAALGRGRGPGLSAGLVLLELALVGQARGARHLRRLPRGFDPQPARHRRLCARAVRLGRADRRGGLPGARRLLLAADRDLVAPGVSGAGRALAATYALFALAAGARSAVQIAARFGDAPLPYVLSGVAAAIYLLLTFIIARPDPDWRRLALAACAFELAGVLAVGTLSFADAGAFPDETVWSAYGRGYGFVPLVLPLLGLVFLRSRRPQVG